MKLKARKPTRKQIASVQKAIDYFGGTNISLAKEIGVGETIVRFWRIGERPVSLQRAIMIEKVTKGHVKVSDLIDIKPK